MWRPSAIRWLPSDGPPIVAEAPLPRTEDIAHPGDSLIVATSVVPVPMRAGFEADASPDAIVVRAATGEPLAAITVPSSEVEYARAKWRTSILAAEAQSCAVLLMLTGPLLDWRRLLRSVGGHLTLTVAILNFCWPSHVLSPGWPFA